MRFKKKIKKKLYPVELFLTINDGGIWQHNWEQLMLTGKKHWLIKDRREKHRKVSDTRFEQAYFKLYDEYSEATGDTERMYEWSLLMQKRMEARALYGAGDLSQINLINMYTAMIDALMEGDEDVDIIEDRIYIQQLYGQKINEKETTVGTYLKYKQVVFKQNRPRNSNPDGES